MQPLPLSKLEALCQLGKIASRINQHHEQSLWLMRGAKEKALEFKSESALCGKALLEAKALVRRRKWSAWISEKCRFSYATANRYINAAKFKEAYPAEFEAAQSLREIAAILAGENAIAKETAQPNALCRFTQWLTSKMNAIQSVMEEANNPEARRTLKSALKPFAELHARL